MKYICEQFCKKVNANINSLLFLYGGIMLNMDRKFEEYTKENIMNVLVCRNYNEVYPQCGNLLDNQKIENLILFNNNINSVLFRLKSQIDNIINARNLQINEIFNQLRNINFMLNHVIEDIKKIMKN